MTAALDPLDAAVTSIRGKVRDKQPVKARLGREGAVVDLEILSPEKGATIGVELTAKVEEVKRVRLAPQAGKLSLGDVLSRDAYR